MELMVLKIPPDKAAKVAAALENWSDNNPDSPDVEDIDATVSWLNYRVAKWRAAHPETAQA